MSPEAPNPTEYAARVEKVIGEISENYIKARKDSIEDIRQSFPEVINDVEEFIRIARGTEVVLWGDDGWMVSDSFFDLLGSEIDPEFEREGALEEKKHPNDHKKILDMYNEYFRPAMEEDDQEFHIERTENEAKKRIFELTFNELAIAED